MTLSGGTWTAPKLLDKSVENAGMVVPPLTQLVMLDAPRAATASRVARSGGLVHGHGMALTDMAMRDVPSVLSIGIGSAAWRSFFSHSNCFSTDKK